MDSFDTLFEKRQYDLIVKANTTLNKNKVIYFIKIRWYKNE